MSFLLEHFFALMTLFLLIAVIIQHLYIGVLKLRIWQRDNLIRDAGIPWKGDLAI